MIPSRIEKVEDLPEDVLLNSITGKERYFQIIRASYKPSSSEDTSPLSSEGQVADKPATSIEPKKLQETEPEYPTVYDPVFTSTNHNKQIFNVVTGSFRKSENAAEMAATVTTMGFQNVSILYRNNLYRVVVEKFIKEPNARKFLSELKSDHPKFTKAWLYIEDM